MRARERERQLRTHMVFTLADPIDRMRRRGGNLALGITANLLVVGFVQERDEALRWLEAAASLEDPLIVGSGLIPLCMN